MQGDGAGTAGCPPSRSGEVAGRRLGPLREATIGRVELGEHPERHQGHAGNAAHRHGDAGPVGLYPPQHGRQGATEVADGDGCSYREGSDRPLEDVECHGRDHPDDRAAPPREQAPSAVGDRPAQHGRQVVSEAT